MAAEADPGGILIALSNAVPGREDQFNDWYTGTHIPEILRLPGFVSAQRYEVDEAAGADVPYRYATVYRVEGSPAAARDRLFSAGLGSSPAMDHERMLFGAYAPLGAPLHR